MEASHKSAKKAGKIWNKFEIGYVLKAGNKASHKSGKGLKPTKIYY
jgi:hypothetical protein